MNVEAIKELASKYAREVFYAAEAAGTVLALKNAITPGLGGFPPIPSFEERIKKIIPTYNSLNNGSNKMSIRKLFIDEYYKILNILIEADDSVKQQRLKRDSENKLLMDVVKDMAERFALEDASKSKPHLVAFRVTINSRKANPWFSEPMPEFAERFKGLIEVNSKEFGPSFFATILGPWDTPPSSFATTVKKHIEQSYWDKLTEILDRMSNINRQGGWRSKRTRKGRK